MSKDLPLYRPSYSEDWFQVGRKMLVPRADWNAIQKSGYSLDLVECVPGWVEEHDITEGKLKYVWVKFENGDRRRYSIENLEYDEAVVKTWKHKGLWDEKVHENTIGAVTADKAPSQGNITADPHKASPGGITVDKNETGEVTVDRKIDNKPGGVTRDSK